MKIIGKKYRYFVWMFVAIIFFIIAITLCLIYFNKKDAGWPFIFPLVVLVGIFIWYSYYVFFLPDDIVSYDKDSKVIIVRKDKFHTVKISLSDVKDVSLHRPFDRAAWDVLTITLNDGTIVEATGIEEDNEIKSNLFSLNK